MFPEHSASGTGPVNRADCARRCRRGRSWRSRSDSRTETTGMKSTLRLCVVLVLIGCGIASVSLNAAASELKKGCGPCSSCGPCGGGAGSVTPYGDMGCGPRYCGAKHDEPWSPDPCDGCNRWRGCNGAQERQDMLAPWQLPPCRGFQTAADVGYAGNGGGGPCNECRAPGYWVW
jgi:hypothetical protein